MDALERVVSRVVARCDKRGVVCSEPLAAFVARTTVFDYEHKFMLGREMTQESLEELIDLTTDRVCDPDSPSLETVKMQVRFDKVYTEGRALYAECKRTKDEQLAELQRQIVAIKASSGTGFENFTALYRKIFAYLMLNSRPAYKEIENGEGKTGADRSAERECAAALESVFPRVALKSFMTMRSEDKRKQLAELTNIVLGIRLFNREIGKGGADLDVVPLIAAQEGKTLAGAIDVNLVCAFVSIPLSFRWGNGRLPPILCRHPPHVDQRKTSFDVLIMYPS